MLLSDADLGLALDCFWYRILLTCCKVLDWYSATIMTLSDTRGGVQVFRMQLETFRETNITVRTSLSTEIDTWFKCDWYQDGEQVRPQRLRRSV